MKCRQYVAYNSGCFPLPRLGVMVPLIRFRGFFVFTNVVHAVTW